MGVSVDSHHWYTMLRHFFESLKSGRLVETYLEHRSIFKTLLLAFTPRISKKVLNEFFECNFPKITPLFLKSIFDISIHYIFSIFSSILFSISFDFTKFIFERKSLTANFFCDLWLGWKKLWRIEGRELCRQVSQITLFGLRRLERS